MKPDRILRSVALLMLLPASTVFPACAESSSESVAIPEQTNVEAFPVDSSGDAQAPDDDAIIEERIEKISVGMSLSEVREILGCTVVELGYIAWGGSGNRAIVFIIAGQDDMHINVDFSDIVTAQPAFESPRTWKREPGGRLTPM